MTGSRRPNRYAFYDDTFRLLSNDTSVHELCKSFDYCFTDLCNKLVKRNKRKVFHLLMQ